MGLLEKKIAVVTGAAAGIGAATALKMAEQGAGGLVIADIDFEKAAGTAVSIQEKTGCPCTPCKTDVSAVKDVEALFNLVLVQYGSLDVLVNCAGICTVGAIEDIGEKEWDRVMGVNVKGSYLCAREALRLMKPRRTGRIVNVSSLAGRVGGISTGINYATSKGAVITMTMSLAKAAGPFNINVNAVAPGSIDTAMTRGVLHCDPETIPLKRIGTPEEVADVIVFLASDLARYITGGTIDVNGGMYMT